MAGSLVITGASSGEASGSRVIGPLNIAGSTAVGETLFVALTSGDNTFAVPTGAVACVLVPPSANTFALKYRTSLNAADGGLPINPGAVPTVHAFPSPAPATITINAASLVTGGMSIVFV